MHQYRVKLGLTERLPEDLVERKLTYGRTEVAVTTGRNPPSLEISPIEAIDHSAAELVARRALNNLLNYFAATVQFRGTLGSGYEYENLDSQGDRGIVVTPEPARGYLSKVELPDGFSLRLELKAAAFLRRGDSSSDTFDRFRNYYLAVDAVGKTLRPSGKDSTVILDTIEQVASADVLLNLDNQVRAIVPDPSSDPATPAERLNAALYGPYRCALMHSGSSTDFTPFDPDDESTVRRVLNIMRGVAWQYVKYERRLALGASKATMSAL